MSKTKKTNTTTPEDKTTPNVKTMNGKVYKVRVNIRNCARLKGQSPANNSNKKLDQNAPLKRQHANSISLHKNNCNTLQAQCKDSKNKSRSVAKSETNSILLKTSKARRRIEAGKYNNNEKLPEKINNDSKRISSNAETQPPGVTTRRRQQNNAISLSSVNTRRCIVGLQKNPATDLKRKSCNNKSSPTDRQQNQSNSLIPGTAKRCVVKLRKIPETIKTQINLIDSLTFNNRKQFVVSIEKIENSTSKSITTKNNELAGIKQIARLSLKRPSIGTSKNKVILKGPQFESVEKSTICFEPAQNSTLLNLTKSKHLQNPNKESEITTPSKNRSLSRNLANRSEEIEKVLNSVDDEEELLLNSIKNNISAHNKTKKFFHREKNIQESILKEQPSQNTRSPKTQKPTKSRRFRTKGSTIVKRDNIYEFFSQSQTSDSDIAKHIDPTADIIKKLIEQGKVQVATNCRGTGKPKFKRKKPQRKKNSENKTSKKLKQLKNNTKKVKFAEENENDGLEDNNFEDHFDNDEQFVDLDYDMETQRRNIVPNISNNPNHLNLTSEQEGTFSSLARSAIINQAGRSDWQRINPSVLLRDDLNFFSTPKNKKTLPPQTAVETDISPIVMAPPRPASMTSPWRVNEEAHLPTTFNFSRSSGNLPSFSSDFIPLSPRKEKRKIRTNWTQQTAIKNKKSPTKSSHNDDIENMKLQTSNLREPSVISSFSSNDSNAENMPPPSRTPENYNQNEGIFNFQQLPNPRKTLNHRSPLKAINIVEVINLPPYKHPNKITIPEKQIEMFCSEENFNDSNRGEQDVATVTAEQRKDSLQNTETRPKPKDDLFGFEEYLSQTEYSSQENNESNNDDMRQNGQNKTIHDKLQDLRMLKPDENEYQKFSINPMKKMTLFVDDAKKVDGMRQRGIKEMLSSTLLHPKPSTSKEALRELKKANLKNPKPPKFGNDLDQSELFKDIEPETTFNEDEAHRTYVRAYKRKPRLREGKYVVYLDSDESEDEDNSHEQQQREHSREPNSSPEKAPKKKRHRKEPKEKPEMLEFVKEFNEMCKDVDSYNLLIEKSA